MSDRFTRDLVRAGRADASPSGARERALAALGIESGPSGAARFASGAALVALLALVLGWAPPASQAAAPVDHATQCTGGIEAPPCADAGVRLAGGARGPTAPTGSSGSGGYSGRSSG
ncbi:MAG TPA: hypothetical protein VMI75_14630 [Polyangiaceae bacterium]|nr:hypothetical protein [Polyangiaceae bacterium]